MPLNRRRLYVLLIVKVLICGAGEKSTHAFLHWNSHASTSNSGLVVPSSVHALRQSSQASLLKSVADMVLRARMTLGMDSLRR